jgi:SrtB family sortase
MREKIRKLLIIICVAVLAFVSWQIGSYLWGLHNEKAQDEQVIKEIKEAMQNDSESTETEAGEPFQPDKYTYGYMHGINSDYVGWLKWDSNIINTYIMQPPTDDTEKYLYNNIYGNRVYGGSAFINSTATLDSQNLTIYGHSVFATNTYAIQMMFSPLRNMLQQSYYESNKTFKIYYESEIVSYEVFAVAKVDISTDDWAYTKSSFDDENEVQSWLNQAYSRSTISSNLEVTPNDRFVTFQTCMYREGNERVIVVAKEMSREAYPED